MPRRERIERLRKRFLGIYWRRGEEKLTTGDRIEQIVEDVMENWILRSEHEGLKDKVRAAIKQVEEPPRGDGNTDLDFLITWLEDILEDK